MTRPSDMHGKTRWIKPLEEQLEWHWSRTFPYTSPTLFSSRGKTGIVVMAVVVQRRERMKNSGLRKYRGKKNLLFKFQVCEHSFSYRSVFVQCDTKHIFLWSWFRGCVYHNQTFVAIQTIPPPNISEEEIILNLPTKEPCIKHCYILIHNNWLCDSISFKAS